MPEAISLAREYDISAILPSVLYALSLQRWSVNSAFGRPDAVLSDEDRRRLGIGRQRLQGIHARLVSDPLSTGWGRMPQSFHACRSCRAFLERYWCEKLAVDERAPHDCRLLRELHRMTMETDDILEGSVCGRCLLWHTQTPGSICS
ncbi:hypothetical protein OBBRIDRAFT_130812 [Obba rivulosa]|uniref:Uncharacterized protein n=1 Tax=Obba rivulosa TaxID=1052685 RepID=A0A8E2DJH0_9APHY|nr:hypothetical protein OBBRIDRAFT_130812 [Obba rivulosa]